jgi:hypothetical protein
MNRTLAITALALGLLAGCQSAPDCSPQRGFELGRSDRPAVDACQDAAYQGAWRLGQTLHELDTERANLMARQEDLDAGERMRLRVIERDIPELEGLARIQRLMPPAEIPE